MVGILNRYAPFNELHLNETWSGTGLEMVVNAILGHFKLNNYFVREDLLTD